MYNLSHIFVKKFWDKFSIQRIVRILVRDINQDSLLIRIRNRNMIFIINVFVGYCNLKILRVLIRDLIACL